MGDISPEEVEQLEKMAMILVVGAKPISERTDQQLKDGLIMAEKLNLPLTAAGVLGGATIGGIAGGQLSPKSLRGWKGAALGAAAGGLGVGALAQAGKHIETNIIKRHLADRQQDKTASVSPIGRAGANAAVADKSNNLQTVMKNVPAEDRDDVLRALRQMKKTASSYQPKVASATRSRLEKIAMGQLGTLGQMGILMGGAALAPVVGQLASAGINRLMQKSQAQIQQDLKRVLEVHPEIGRPEDPRVQMAYNSLVKLNPTYAEDPLIAGPLLKQIVESRMDPTNPMSNPIVDPGIAKNLSEARKSIREGDPRDTFGGAMGQSLSQGVQMATLGGLAAPGTPQGQPAPGGFFR